MHHAGTDRRLDEWADQSRIDLSTVKPDVPGSMDEDVGQARRRVCAHWGCVAGAAPGMH